MYNFKNTITKKGYFYFIKEYEGDRNRGFVRVTEEKFKHIKAAMSELSCFITKHQDDKTEHFFSGKIIHKLTTLSGVSYF